MQRYVFEAEGFEMNQPKRFILKRELKITQADWTSFFGMLAFIFMLSFLYSEVFIQSRKIYTVLLVVICSYLFNGKYPYGYKTILEEIK